MRRLTDLARYRGRGTKAGPRARVELSHGSVVFQLAHAI
jgi:hypothetical protein